MSATLHHPVDKRANFLIVASLCLVAFALRLGPAFQNRFHADEALYASWALHVASGRDLLLASVPVDKPPLSIYAMAASLSVLGRSEIGARLPNLFASVVSVVLACRWAKTLTPNPSPVYGRGEIVIALVMSLSPFNVAFGGTAFLDPLMVMWGLAAFVAAGRGRAGWGGVLLGLAAATKVQGLLFAPLMVLTAKLAEDAKRRKTSALSASSAVRFAVGFGAIAAMTVAWSLARGGTPFWVQQTIDYGGIRFAYASELGPRLSDWLRLLPFFFGPIVGLLLLVGIVLLASHALTRAARTRSAALDLLLIAYAIGFLALHWLLAFPVWDRYLLPLVPVASVLFGRATAWLAGRAPYSRSQITIMLRRPTMIYGAITLVMLPYTIGATRSELPIGGDHGPHDGIDRVAAYLRGAPIGSVVYDHWLGWEFGFYLWDAPVYRAYFDTPADLARDLHVFGRTSTRYLVLPAGEPSDKIARAIGAEGFGLAAALTTTNRLGGMSFTVYRIVAQ
jgi:4-amino-4-deoxy-L-arabinose transferase-like glycosyltransferase